MLVGKVISVVRKRDRIRKNWERSLAISRKGAIRDSNWDFFQILFQVPCSLRGFQNIFKISIESWRNQAFFLRRSLVSFCKPLKYICIFGFLGILRKSFLDPFYFYVEWEQNIDLPEFGICQKLKACIFSWSSLSNLSDSITKYSTISYLKSSSDMQYRCRIWLHMMKFEYLKTSITHFFLEEPKTIISKFIQIE